MSTYFVYQYRVFSDILFYVFALPLPLFFFFFEPCQNIQQNSNAHSLLVKISLYTVIVIIGLLAVSIPEVRSIAFTSPTPHLPATFHLSPQTSNFSLWLQKLLTLYSVLHA